MAAFTGRNLMPRYLIERSFAPACDQLADYSIRLVASEQPVQEGQRSFEALSLEGQVMAGTVIRTPLASVRDQS